MGSNSFLPGKTFNMSGNIGTYRGAYAGAINFGALISHYALLQIVPEDYYEASSRAPGYKELPDVGKRAFVVPEESGWA